MKDTKFGSVDIKDYVKIQKKLTGKVDESKELSKVIQTIEAGNTIFNCELPVLKKLRKRAKVLKMMTNYQEIDVSFLKMHYTKKKITFPKFAVHRISGETIEVCELNLEIESKSNSTFVFDYDGQENILHDMLIEALVPDNVKTTDSNRYTMHLSRNLFNVYCESFDVQDTEDEATLAHTFIGLIPAKTKEKIKEASSLFDDVFLVSEATSWTKKKITKDPLIIGLIDKTAFLINHFNTTPIEKYITMEF